MGRQCVVLVAESVRAVGQVLRVALEESTKDADGIVVLVTDTEEAVRVLQGVAVDCVVWDWSLSLNSTGLVQGLKPSRVPVVGIIGSEEQRNQASEAGCDTVISKPIKVDEVARAVTMCLSSGGRTLPTSLTSHPFTVG